ncbi:MAG: hypothetical protein M1816_001729 [Peltula sp. TS41687]|nr:MAG: hypothetical protein M1816_001729 [Peltula sp. TS41687]
MYGVTRFLGTCIGAILAVLAWYITQGNPYGLATLGWLISLCCSYIIIAQGKGPMGRFILLTYNLSALYAYSLSVKDQQDDDDEGGTHPYIVEIAFHRVVAVTTGCLWGLIITRFVWPISARKKLKEGLSLLWLRMALVWKTDPLSTLIRRESTTSYLDIREEFELQRYLSHLETLRVSAASEFALKEPFPSKVFEKILQSTGRMLDAFHAMNIAMREDQTASEVLASSMKLRYPLTDVLPNIENARDRLLAKMFKYRKDHENAGGVPDEDFALLYAYVLLTGQLAQEIKNISAELERLYGTLDEERFILR